jgi:predicted ribosome quality control (RQC) complex YloA/Tae2 family protein
MQAPNVTLRFLVDEIAQSAAGAILKKIQAVSADSFRFKLYTPQGSRDLIVSPYALFWCDYRLVTTDDNRGFVEFLKSRIEGKKIRAVTQHANDRVLVLSFDGYSLVLELLAPPNIILVDDAGVTAGCLRRDAQKNRTIWPKKPYAFPSSNPLPSGVGAEEFHQGLVAADKPLVQALLSQYNLFPLLAEEAVAAAGLPNAAADTLTRAQTGKLYATLCAFEHLPPAPQTVPYRNDTLLLPFALQQVFARSGLVPVPHPDFSTPVSDDFVARLSALTHADATSDVSKRGKALQKSADQLKESDAKFTAQVAENQKKGEWLYTNYVEVNDLFHALVSARAKKLSDAQVVSALQSREKTIGRFVAEVNLKNRRVVLDVPDASADGSKTIKTKK